MNNIFMCLQRYARGSLL